MDLHLHCEKRRKAKTPPFRRQSSFKGLSPGHVDLLRERVKELPYRASSFRASLSSVHFVKSIGFPHPLQVWGRLNSSEKISFSLPQSGHLQVKDFKLLRSSNPGQCCGVVMLLVILASLFPCE
jgi:hypothetical protein